MAVVKEDQILVTEEGLIQLKNELEYLKDTRRKEIADRLKEAISYGDLSENSEYQEAKEEQAFLEGKIVELEKKIKVAKVVKESHGSTVRIGSVVVLEVSGEKPQEYTVVGSTEADPFNFKISNESPVGKAVLGKKKGAVVTVKAPAGEVEYKVVEVK